MWFIFAFISQALWSFNNVVDKYILTNKLRDPSSYNILTMLFDIVPISLYLLILPVNFSPALILGVFAGLLTVVALQLFNEGIMKEEASRMVSLVYTSPIFVVFMSVIFLNEVVTFNNYLGIGLVVIGAILISTKNSGHKLVLSKIVVIALLSAFVFALSTILSDSGLGYMTYWQFWFWACFGSFIGALIMLIHPVLRKKFKRSMESIRLKTLGLAFLTCIVFYIAQLSFFFAISMGPVSLVASVLSLEPLVTLVFATLVTIYNPKLVREIINKNEFSKKLVAIVLSLVGVYLITA